MFAKGVASFLSKYLKLTQPDTPKIAKELQCIGWDSYSVYNGLEKQASANCYSTQLYESVFA